MERNNRNEEDWNKNGAILTTETIKDPFSMGKMKTGSPWNNKDQVEWNNRNEDLFFKKQNTRTEARYYKSPRSLPRRAVPCLRSSSVVPYKNQHTHTQQKQWDANTNNDKIKISTFTLQVTNTKSNKALLIGQLEK